jgi:hypothetical protein
MADPQDTFAVTDGPAVLMCENLEIKYRIARSGGRLIEGDA